MLERMPYTIEIGVVRTTKRIQMTTTITVILFSFLAGSVCDIICFRALFICLSRMINREELMSRIVTGTKQYNPENSHGSHLLGMEV